MPVARSTPLAALLARQRFVVLDGGLATELERRGADLRDPLWSARVLLEHPDLIRAVHRDYFEAGADVAISASYQASMPGLLERGLSPAEAERLISTSVRLAIEARDQFLEANAAARGDPLVAASIGPYGAYLHDGSEYTGRYDITDRELARFHRDRFDILASTEADLLAFETIPSIREAEILIDHLERLGGRHAWISLTGRDSAHIADGTRFAHCVEVLSQSPWVAAVGLNCTPPELIGPLLESAGPVAAASPPFVVYPNSGETYQAKGGSWHGRAHPGDIATAVDHWVTLGARLIGGCCRTGPETIREVRERLAA